MLGQSTIGRKEWHVVDCVLSTIHTRMLVCIPLPYDEGHLNMAMASSCRSRSLKSSRSARRRFDSDDDFVPIDFSRDAVENLTDILKIVVSQRISKGKKLGSLNNFVKLWQQLEIQKLKAPSMEKIICCLRVSLFHEAREVRAAGLRAIRYIIRDDTTIDIILKLNVHFLIIRCLDVYLDNQTERLQALRLIRTIFHTSPVKFPKAFTYCLIAIANDGNQEHDHMLRACVATLGELVISNPGTCSSVGIVSAILNNILQCQLPRISEALMGSILFLLNHPKTRVYIKPHVCLEQIVAPFTDCHHRSVEYLGDEEEERFVASKLAILAALRSWPGLLRLCKPGDSGVQTLVDVLYLPYPDARNGIIEIIYEVFRLSIPEWTEDFSLALLACDTSTMQESWKLYDGFVTEEGRTILPYLGTHRPNLVENYLALLLLAFISAGVLEALIEVIATSSNSLSIKATILLGELLHLANTRLPNECSHHSHCLPSLMSLAASFDSSPECRQRASSAVTFLNRLHTIKRRGAVPCSLFLDQLVYFSSKAVANFCSKRLLSRTKIVMYLKKESDDLIGQAIKDTLVLSGQSYSNWDWELIASILKWPGDSLKKLEDSNKSFIRKLVSFFKPCSRQFSCIDQNQEDLRKITLTGNNLMDFLAENDDAESLKIVDEFLADFGLCISQVTMENAPMDHIFSPSRLMTTLSQYYFLFIGRLSHSKRGRRILEKAGTLQCLLSLINVTAHDCYLKLIISSLDYSHDGIARIIFTKVLTATSESARLYATNFMRVLSRLRVEDFNQWGIELLVTQLYDRSRAVSLAAMDVLDEACDDVTNLEAVISMRPSLLHLGDRGQLLLVRFTSLPSGFKFLMRANYLNAELEKWKKNFCVKYVKIVEAEIHDALTHHQRGEDGKYQRRSSQRHRVRDVYVPPHLYGQLVQHKAGIELLMEKEILSPLVHILQLCEVQTEDQVLNLKSALWALGHIATSENGVLMLNKEQVFQDIVKLAEECPVFSVRGTCFYILGLMSTTPAGADLLSQLGWESLRHHRGEHWPVVEDPLNNHPIPVDEILNEVEDDLIHSVDDSHISRSRSLGARAATFNGFDDASSLNENDNDGPLSFTAQSQAKQQPSLKMGFSFDGDGLAYSTVAEKSQTLPCPGRTLLATSSFDYGVLQTTYTSPTSPVKVNGDFYQHGTLTSSYGSLGSTHSNVGSQIKLQLNVSTKERNRSRSFTDASTSTASVLNSHDSTTNKLRSVSNIEIVQSSEYNETSVTKEERSDSNDSKSRSDSCTDSTSGIGSCDSGTGKLGIVEHAQTLSPIASSTSLNTLSTRSVHHSDNVRKLANLRYTPLVLHRYPTVPRNQLSPDTQPDSPFVYTTTRDAAGYATLRNIQRRRIVSLEICPSVTTRQNRLHKTRSLEDNKQAATLDLFPDGSTSRSFYQRQQSLQQMNVADLGNTAESEQKRYMGICLPVDISMIFTIEGKEEQKHYTPCLTRIEEQPGEQLTAGNCKMHISSEIFDHSTTFSNYHSVENCLKCSRNFTSSPINEQQSDEPLENQSLVDSLPSRSNDDQHTPENQPVIALINNSEMSSSTILGSFGSVDSMDGNSTHQLTADSNAGKALVRKEVMRFIISLSSSVATKPAEQGLLCLKQKFPKSFQDLCLYSEVVCFMCDCNFRLTARRFIQELFLDLTFEELYEEPLHILSCFESDPSCSKILATYPVFVEKIQRTVHTLPLPLDKEEKLASICNSASLKDALVVPSDVGNNYLPTVDELCFSFDEKGLSSKQKV